MVNSLHDQVAIDAGSGFRREEPKCISKVENMAMTGDPGPGTEPVTIPIVPPDLEPIEVPEQPEIPPAEPLVLPQPEIEPGTEEPVTTPDEENQLHNDMSIIIGYHDMGHFCN